MRDPIVGIDLGTSNTVVAHADEGSAVSILADASGHKIHPSVVSFHPSGGVVVGAAAKQRKVIDPKNTIFSVKRLIGRGYNSREVQTAKQRMPYQIKEGANQLPLVVTRGGEFAIPEISAIVLDHAKNVATSALGTPVTRAVVTVPASFNDAQRSATATAGSIAGLTVVRVLNEPTAAALAYGNTRSMHETIAVYDFGGGTFDVTILKLADQVYEVLGTAGNSFLGGDDLDERLVDRMVEKFLAENRVDLRTNEVSMMRLRAVAEQTKIELSRRSRAVVRVDEIAYGPKGKPLDLQIEIRREEFVTHVADIVDKTFPVCEESLKLAGLGVSQIDDVILVGGTTKIPYVRDQVTKFFGKAPRTDVNPEDAVAAGAALQAIALQRILKRTVSKSPPLQSAGERMESFDEADATFSGTGESMDTMSFAEDFLADTRDEPAPLAGERGGERRAIRGAHHDVFEDRTPPPRPPTAPVLARMTKPGPPVAGPKRTSIGIPITAPLASMVSPAFPTPPAPPSTAPRMTVQRPPASPSTRTFVAPVATPTAEVSTVIVDPSGADDDFGFPSVNTEKGFIDLDDGLVPSAMGTGFGALDLGVDPRGEPTAGPTARALPPSPAVTQRGMATATPRGPATAAAMPAPPTTPTARTLIVPSPVVTAASRPSPVVLDVTPRGLGIGTVAGFCEELIRRNSRVPAEKCKMFTTSRDDQDAVRIIVVQGESRRMDSNTVIADLRLDNLPRRPRGETSIEVTFMLDASGILQIRARDPQTGREQHASLDIVGSIAQEDVSLSREKLQALSR